MKDSPPNDNRTNGQPERSLVVETSPGYLQTVECPLCGKRFDDYRKKQREFKNHLEEEHDFSDLGGRYE